MVLEATYGRVVLPVGKTGRATEAPGRALHRPIQFRMGEPGIKVGQ